MSWGDRSETRRRMMFNTAHGSGQRTAPAVATLFNCARCGLADRGENQVGRQPWATVGGVESLAQPFDVPVEVVLVENLSRIT